MATINRALFSKKTASARRLRTEASWLHITGMFMAFVCFISLFSVPCAATEADPINAGQKTAAYILKTVTDPYPGDVGGEWVIAALEEGGYTRPDGYFQIYYNNLKEFLDGCGGVISTRKYAEYSKTIYGATAAGYNAAEIHGYDLIMPLGDYDTTVMQGINGPTWALIALDSGNYEIPNNSEAKTQATRDMYIKYILSKETEGGGFALMGKYADPDITAMALQALSKYTDREDVSAAVDRAVNKLSELQQEDGGFKSMGDANAESAAQVIIALCRLGISINDPRFVKNGCSPLDNMLTFQNTDGSFCHLKGDGGDPTATEQAFSALAALTKIERARIKGRIMTDRTMMFRAKTGRYKGVLLR